jgi:hypothetical protein
MGNGKMNPIKISHYALLFPQQRYSFFNNKGNFLTAKTQRAQRIFKINLLGLENLTGFLYFSLRSLRLCG